MKSVLIVCWGNIFRSPVVETMLNRKMSELGFSNIVFCISRGIQGQGGIPAPKFNTFPDYTEEYKLAKPVMDRYGINIDSHVAKPVDAQTAKNADLIIALGKKVLSDEKGGLSTFGKEVVAKSVVYEIPDPAEESELNKYDVVVPEILAAVDIFFPKFVNFIENRETVADLRNNIENNRSKKEIL